MNVVPGKFSVASACIKLLTRFSVLQKVEDASSNAAAAAFGGRNAQVKPKGRSAAMTTVEDLHLHDAAYSEGTLFLLYSTFQLRLG